MEQIMKILIVDDMPANCLSIIKRIRQQLSIPVVLREAYTQNGAIRQINDFQPDLVILDLDLNNDPYGGFKVWEAATFRRFNTIILTGDYQPGLENNEYTMKALNMRMNPLQFCLKPLGEKFDAALQLAYQQTYTIDGRFRNDQGLYFMPDGIGRTLMKRADTLPEVHLENLKNKLSHYANEDTDNSSYFTKPFFQIHGSCVVNLSYVLSWQEINEKNHMLAGGYAQLSNGEYLEVSARNKATFRRILRYFQDQTA